MLLFNLSDNDWKLLKDLLEIIKPISKHLESDKRLSHYLERIYFYSNRVIHRENCVNVLNLVTNMFPQVSLV